MMSLPAFPDLTLRQYYFMAKIAKGVVWATHLRKVIADEYRVELSQQAFLQVMSPLIYKGLVSSVLSRRNGDGFSYRENVFELTGAGQKALDEIGTFAQGIQRKNSRASNRTARARIERSPKTGTV